MTLDLLLCSRVSFGFSFRKDKSNRCFRPTVNRAIEISIPAGVVVDVPRTMCRTIEDLMLEGTDKPLRVPKVREVWRIKCRRRRRKWWRGARRAALENLPGYLLEVLPPETLFLVVSLCALTVLVQATGCDRPVVELYDVGTSVYMTIVEWANVKDPPSSLTPPSLRFP